MRQGRIECDASVTVPRIHGNIPALVARRFHSMNRLALQRSLYKLASGQRINRAIDDPSGLVASNHLRNELAALEAESRVVARNHVRAATADGALEEVSRLLREARALALENANTAGTTVAEREANQGQIDLILASVDRIGTTTQFNGQKLLDGSATLALGSSSLSIGETSAAALGESEISGVTYHLSDIKSGGSLDTSAGHATDAYVVINSAIGAVATMRGRIGTFQRHAVEPRANALRVAIENVMAANSMILDTDTAAETSRFVRLRLLEHASRGAMTISRASHRNALSILHEGLRVR